MYIYTHTIYTNVDKNDVQLQEWSTVCAGLAVEVVCLDVCGYLLLPPVSIAEQLLLVVQQLLMCLSGKLKVWALQ